MSNEVRPRKQPITGRSAKDRALDRADSATKVEAAAKKRSAAMETRLNIAVGSKAMSLAANYPMVRSLIASAAAEHSATDLGGVLKVKAAGSFPLEDRLNYNQAWNAWELVRKLNDEIELAWAMLEPTLSEGALDEQGQFEDLVTRVRALADEWETLVGAEHPLGRILRTTE